MMMYAYKSEANAFYLRADIIPTQNETIVIPTVDEHGNPVMEYSQKLDADGTPVTEDVTLDDGSVVQMPVMEHVQATHPEQRPVYPPLPAGYVEVTEEEHTSLFTAQSQGMVIQPDPAGTGRPVALPPTPPTEAEALAQAKAEKRRAIIAAHEPALAGALALSDPTPSTVAVESALLAVEDAAGLEYVREVMNTRRAALLAAVNAAGTLGEVEAVVVSYPV